MNKFYASFLLLAFCITYVCSEPYLEHSANAPNQANSLLREADADGQNADVDASNYDKRVERYAFGLGRRAYTYNSGGSGVKRLPIYNFGLGKRARPYSFGLGKRNDFEDDTQYDADLDHNSYNQQGFMDEKRNRPYSFGLGKRDGLEEVDRRGYPNRYGFGLGRR